MEHKVVPFFNVVVDETKQVAANNLRIDQAAKLIEQLAELNIHAHVVLARLEGAK